ncbi:twin-arginine translocase TatA/TatE family subunit [candidate division KSB1 bacterium]|nr:twin-arginine translocase TatA/TatE family subunit [candidate division KSB1 bacterium]
MFGSIGSFELFLILLVALLLFGSKQLPQVARNIGKGLRDFQKATQGAKDEIQRLVEDDDEPDLKG